LTRLQHLQLERVEELDAQLLSHLTHLTHLQLVMKPHAIRRSTMAPLLDLLPCNAQLQHLQLEVPGAYNPEHEFITVKPQQCSGLISSSHLISLQLSGVQLPRSCGKLLFPAGRTLLHLTTLKLRGKIKWVWNTLRQEYCFEASTPPIGPAGDLYRLVESCPNLEDLDLAGSVQCGVDMSPLRHVRHLTSLVVGGPSVDDRCAARLGQLTGLRTLAVIDPGCKEEPRVGFGKVCKPKSQLSSYVQGYGRYDCSAASENDEGGWFTFNGLRSLMQLRDLTTFAIDRDSCLFRDLGSSDGHYLGYEELAECKGWLDSRLQDLLSCNAAWQAYLLQEREEHLAGGLRAQCRKPCVQL
jgi:hypothetical protein